MHQEKQKGKELNNILSYNNICTYIYVDMYVCMRIKDIVCMQASDCMHAWKYVLVCVL